MEYCIAGDDGSAGIWNRPFDVDLDGDGRLDAIGLDLDGDGLRAGVGRADLDPQGAPRATGRSVDLAGWSPTRLCLIDLNEVCLVA